MLLADIKVRTCVQEECILQRIAQNSLVSLLGNRIDELPAPYHANRHNSCNILVLELIVKYPIRFSDFFPGFAHILLFPTCLE